MLLFCLHSPVGLSARGCDLLPHEVIVLTNPRSVKDSAFLLTKYIRFFTSLTYPTELSDLVHKGTMLFSNIFSNQLRRQVVNFRSCRPNTKNLSLWTPYNSILRQSFQFRKCFSHADSQYHGTKFNRKACRSKVVALQRKQILPRRFTNLPFFPRYVTRGLLRVNGWFGLNSWR